jgi:signal transduction histidine kinase
MVGPSFGWGLLVGVAGGLAVASSGAIFLYRRLLRSERRARQAERLAELGTLTGGLAHELKNPLSTIQLNLQLLQEDLPVDNPGNARLVNRLQLVHRETGRLKDILDDFLRYAGRMEVERQPVDLNRLVGEMVDFFTPQAQLNKVQMRFRPAPEPVIVPADAKLIKQALLNLLLNAVQAMTEKGGANNELILSAYRKENDAVIEVIDTAGGMPPEQLARIFDAYYSTKKSGTGLGLAMAKRIVDEHGGRITIDSQVGKGSDFRISLPA